MRACDVSDAHEPCPVLQYLKGGRQQRRFGTSRIDLSKLEVIMAWTL